MAAGVLTSCQNKFPVLAAEKDNRTDMLHSRGRIACKEVILDAADLENICAYITEKRSAVVDTLLQLGTKFRQQGAEIIIDRDPDHSPEAVDREELDWETLFLAVEESQCVPVGLPVLHPDYALGIDGVGERTDCYETASADHISCGKAAWAEGILLLGNGADNEKAYEQGVEDGAQDLVPDQLFPLYTMQEVAAEVRHVHIGQQENKEGTNGCYYNYSTTVTETKKCGRTLEYCPLTQDSDGLWHGGNYQCPQCHATYDSSGTCTKTKTETSTVWRHDIVCGLTDVVYAVIRIRGTDTDYYDREFLLEAELEPGEGYEQFAWQEGEGLLWTDEEGTLLGIGSELTVHGAGGYQCCINVANTDIDIRSAGVQVEVAGLLLPK